MKCCWSSTQGRKDMVQSSLSLTRFHVSELPEVDHKASVDMCHAVKSVRRCTASQVKLPKSSKVMAMQTHSALSARIFRTVVM
jgi:hypothetical protein